MKEYAARNGNVQFKPSIEEVTEMDENGEGMCLACGDIHSGIEPDAARYTCGSCGASKVYGAAEIALMGLAY